MPWNSISDLEKSLEISHMYNVVILPWDIIHLNIGLVGVGHSLVC